MKYGLPYKGSKSKLAMPILNLLPQRAHLYDLFCGGCAVTHAAVLRKKFKSVHANDVNWMCTSLFRDALAGKFKTDHRWISREDFFRLKDSDPYIAFVWSFGSNLRDYLYSREIEPLKKAIHYALFFSDYSLTERMGIDLSFLSLTADLRQRYAMVKKYFAGGCTQSPLPDLPMWTDGGTQSPPGAPASASGAMDIGRGGWVIPVCSTSKETNTSAIFARSKMMAGNARFELQNLESHAVIKGLSVLGGGISSLTMSALDYQEVEILPDSVIYCDIPYRGTNIYDAKRGFDYERFYDWACRQTEPVFVSEYWMPDDRFVCIQEFAHRSLLCATANNAVCERIWVPRHQQERGRECLLFDFV